MRGEFTFLENGGVRMVKLPDCRVRTLTARNARPPLRFSANGRYLAYGDGAVIATRRRSQPRYPLGNVAAWAWSPRATELGAVTERGAVELWRPGLRPRQVAPKGWVAGAPAEPATTGIAFSPDGSLLAVVRTTSWGQPRELWLIDLGTGARCLARRMPEDSCLTLAGFTPNGGDVLFWPDASCAVSVMLDGLPLAAVPTTGGRSHTLVKIMLTDRDFLARCGQRLVATVGAWRETNDNESLALLSPPGYQSVSLRLSSKESWIDPSCSHGGTIAVAAGPTSDNPTSGRQHRSIWLIPAPGEPPRRLTSPGSDSGQRRAAPHLVKRPLHPLQRCPRKHKRRSERRTRAARSAHDRRSAPDRPDRPAGSSRERLLRLLRLVQPDRLARAIAPVAHEPII